MGIQKEREAFQKSCEENFDFERHEQTYFDEQTQCYENDLGECTESINMAWSAWQTAKAQAVPEGFVLVNKKDLVKVLNCVTDDWLVDTDSFEEFKKIESLVQDEVNAMIEAQEPAND